LTGNKKKEIEMKKAGELYILNPNAKYNNSEHLHIKRELCEGGHLLRDATIDELESFSSEDWSSEEARICDVCNVYYDHGYD